MEAALNRPEGEGGGIAAAEQLNLVKWEKGGMDNFDMTDGLAPFYLEALQLNPAVLGGEDGGDKAMAGDVATLAPGGSPHLDFDGGRDDYQGDVENIANNVEDFLNDFLALAEGELDDDLSMNMDMFSQVGDTEARTSPLLPVGEDVASGVEQDVFTSEAPSSTTMSVVPEPTAAAAPVSVVAAAVGITAPGTGGGDPSGSPDVDVTEVSAPADVPVATTSSSTGDDSALTTSEPLATCSNTVPVTAVAATAPSHAPGFSMEGVSPTGGRSGTSNSRAAAIQRYLSKKSRRCWTKASSYKSRQRVANSRPRHKGRFVPQESNFVPIAELKRRQWMELKEKLDAAARAQDDALI